jgi:hypothetical protein
VQTLAPVTETVSFVLTNTGSCSLVEGELLNTNYESFMTLPEIVLGLRETVPLSYTWPNLAAGQHTLDLLLNVMTISGTTYPMDDQIVALTLDVALQLDSDGDTWLDDQDSARPDACPGVWGTVQGCPDRDGDGIRNRLDDCPDLSGPAEFGGCPDTDGDGIRDLDDCCPTYPGPAGFNGCPDRDEDGFPGFNEQGCANLLALDACPDQWGTKTDSGAEGCPNCWNEDCNCREECARSEPPSPGQDPVCVEWRTVCDSCERCETKP